MSNWNEIIKNKELQPDEVDVVIYHSPCSDGTGSGFVAWKYLSSKFPDRNVTYYPMNIGELPPSGLENKNVLICDYSYKKQVLIELLKKVNKLLIIDHHKSAEKDLNEIEDKYKIFDMTHSGAMLTWYYFFPDLESPLMIKYIEDRDIWTKKLPNTDDFASWFYTLPMDFKEYDKYLDDNLLLEMIKTKGIAYGEYNNYLTQQAVKYSVPKFCKINNKYYLVAYVNSTVCKSDIGNKVFDKYVYCDFSVTYSISDSTNSTSFSLRSTKQRADVSEIAFSLNGGGHAAAAGCNVCYVTNYLPGTVYDNEQLYKLLDTIKFETISINEKQLNIAYLNTPIYKHELVHYLMQTKYVDNNKNNISVIENIYMLKNNVSDVHKIDLVIASDYDHNTNMTCCLIRFNDNLDFDTRKNIASKYNVDIVETNRSIDASVSGYNISLF